MIATIAISGAGVAGTALAYWLHRTGHTPTVIERAPAFRSGGYMIDFWGVGYTVAGRMGLEAQILDKGYQIDSVRTVGADGHTLATLDANVFRDLLGSDFTSLPRGDLADTIHSTIAEHVEMIYGDSITAIDEDDDCVRLTFGRSGPREFDLVLLDPPAWAKSAFGTVDLLRDYQSLLKPALLSTAEGGVLICCNNLAKVGLDDWREQVLRCAQKIGRPVREWQVLKPADDFPSLDGQPPLKCLILQL